MVVVWRELQITTVSFLLIASPALISDESCTWRPLSLRGGGRPHLPLYGWPVHATWPPLAHFVGGLACISALLPVMVGAMSMSKAAEPMDEEEMEELERELELKVIR